jgi:mono/diheme cytochrome c family protein
MEIDYSRKTNGRLSMKSLGHVPTRAALVALTISVVAATALAASAATPKLVGNPTAGKALFNTSCAVCHTLSAAGSVGVLGPNLNKLVLTEAAIIAEITNGGAKLVGKPIGGKTYQTAMIAYKSTLSTTVIDNIAAFEYNATHPKAKT